MKRDVESVSGFQYLSEHRGLFTPCFGFFGLASGNSEILGMVGHGGEVERPFCPDGVSDGVLDRLSLGVPVGIVRPGANAKGVRIVRVACMDVQVTPENMPERISLDRFQHRSGRAQACFLRRVEGRIFEAAATGQAGRQAYESREAIVEGDLPNSGLHQAHEASFV